MSMSRQQMNLQVHEPGLLRFGICVSLVLAGLLMAVPAAAQSFDISWHTIDGGGGASVGASFSFSGTVGQPDAQTPPVMSGGAFVLTGGFWAGAPDLCALPGDMNFDGLLNGEDIQRFVDCVLLGSANCSCADVDGGGVGNSDVPAFASALLQR